MTTTWRMRCLALGAGVLLVVLVPWSTAGQAPVGGNVNMRAIENSTGTLVFVGDATNNALRVNLVASASSSTVTANQGTANTAANRWPVYVTDGTNTLPTGDAAARQLFVTGSGGTFPVTGTFWQATQPVSLASVPSHDVTNVGTFSVQVSTFPDNEPVNVAQLNGVAVTMGNGIVGTGVQRVTLASDSTGVVGLNAGSNLIGQAATVGTATTTNTALTSYTASAVSTNATSIKTSAGNVYTISGINTTSTLYYLRLYNLSAAPTCSSSSGFVESIPVPHNAGNGSGFVRVSPVGKSFTTGIAFCLTGGAGSTDNTNAATGVYVTIEYI